VQMAAHGSSRTYGAGGSLCSHLLQEGRAVLLRAFQAQLEEWAPILQRFLKNEDDQARRGHRPY
jgi:hypothetical protein